MRWRDFVHATWKTKLSANADVDNLIYHWRPTGWTKLGFGGIFFDYSGFKRFFGGFSVQRRLDTKLHPRKNITYTILPVTSFSNNQTYKSRLRYEKLNMICIKLYKIFLIHKIWSFEVFKAFKTKKPRFFEALFLSFPALCTRRTDRQTDRHIPLWCNERSV